MLFDLEDYSGTYRGRYLDITKETSTCINTLEDYLLVLSNNTNSGWNRERSSFFNESIFIELGLSREDSTFVFENLFNTEPAVYKGLTLILTGAGKSYNLLFDAFNNGGNLLLPFEAKASLDIISRRTCCESVGGVYKENSIQVSNQESKTYGVCLCQEIQEPCPTLDSGDIDILNDIIEVDGVLDSVTYINVRESCCNDTTLNSKLKGKWVWDGSRCTLDREPNSNKCDEPTIITVSETPIVLDPNSPCNDNKLTLSLYVYFEEPDNRCVNGQLSLDLDPLSDEVIGLLNNPPETTQEISNFESQVNIDLSDNSFIGDGNLTEQTQNTNCCYDTSNPIVGNLIIQDPFKNKVDSVGITYIDTFTTTNTDINTNVSGVGRGFNRWVRLTTEVDLNQVDINNFSLAVEFTSGLYKCCDYNIYFDDIEVGCLKDGVRELIYEEPCVGFDLGQPVIDNKKSWVYNPGNDEISQDTYDIIVRDNDTNGLNIEQTGSVVAGGYGPINRVFAPSLDADLLYRDTDYFNFNGVIEKHSKLVLNTKQFNLTFNMCADNDCLINPSYLLHDNGYVTDEEGGKIIIDYAQFPNLIELERFKKTFQSFWLSFIEQFIPATTIFVAGEKWCNSRICQEKVVNDYFLDATDDDGVLSPRPVTEYPDKEIPMGTPKVEQNETVESDGTNNTDTVVEGEVGTSNVDTPGPVIVGNTYLYGIDNLDRDLGVRVTYTKSLYE